jgi:hypothetical protein
MLFCQQFFQFHGHETLNEISKHVFYWVKGILNSYTQVFKIFQRSTAEHMFLIFDNNKVILKNLTRWKFLVKKEDMSREKSMYGIYDNTSCSYLWFIQRHDSMPNTTQLQDPATWEGTGLSTRHRMLRAMSKGLQIFQKSAGHIQILEARNDDKKQVPYWWSTTQKWH